MSLLAEVREIQRQSETRTEALIERRHQDNRRDFAKYLWLVFLTLAVSIVALVKSFIPPHSSAQPLPATQDTTPIHK